MPRCHQASAACARTRTKSSSCYWLHRKWIRVLQKIGYWGGWFNCGVFWCWLTGLEILIFAWSLNCITWQDRWKWLILIILTFSTLIRWGLSRKENLDTFGALLCTKSQTKLRIKSPCRARFTNRPPPFLRHEDLLRIWSSTVKISSRISYRLRNIIRCEYQTKELGKISLVLRKGTPTSFPFYSQKHWRHQAWQMDHGEWLRTLNTIDGTRFSHWIFCKKVYFSGWDSRSWGIHDREVERDWAAEG